MSRLEEETCHKVCTFNESGLRGINMMHTTTLKACFAPSVIGELVLPHNKDRIARVTAKFKLRLHTSSRKALATRAKRQINYLAHQAECYTTVIMDQSPLARLPPEIRNQIYELALHQPKGCMIEARRSTSKPGLQFKLAYWSTISDPTALTRTCKHIRRECVQMFYVINTFHVFIKDGCLTSDIGSQFFEGMGEANSAALREFVLNIPPQAENTLICNPYKFFHLLKDLRKLPESHPGCAIRIQISLSYEQSCAHHATLNVTDLEASLDDVERDLRWVLNYGDPLYGSTITFFLNTIVLLKIRFKKAGI